MTDEDSIEIIEVHQFSASYARGKRLEEIEGVNIAFRHVSPNAKPMSGYVWLREDPNGYLRWYLQNLDSSD